MESILTSVKKNLGLVESYTVFDDDIVMHINSALATLNQIGIGPEDGFAIVDKTTTWSAFIGSNKKYNEVKSYVTLKVRLIFDPPTTSFLLEAIKEQIVQYEWRLNVVREATEWVDPDPDPITETVLDGGAP